MVVDRGLKTAPKTPYLRGYQPSLVSETMPIYAYRCEDCGHELDALQKISDPPLTECPACGAQALTKQITAAAFRLKGSGWYETDFKKESDKRKNLHQEGEAKKDKPATDQAAEKPAAAAESKPKSKPDTSAAKPVAKETSKPKAAAAGT
jgi:putative FmdB family regulatory protein